VDGEKLVAQVNVRLPESVVAELDGHQRERERVAQIPLSRSLVIREILVEWARVRVRARVTPDGR